MFSLDAFEQRVGLWAREEEETARLMAVRASRAAGTQIQRMYGRGPEEMEERAREKRRERARRRLVVEELQRAAGSERATLSKGAAAKLAARLDDPDDAAAWEEARSHLPQWVLDALDGAPSSPGGAASGVAATAPAAARLAGESVEALRAGTARRVDAAVRAAEEALWRTSVESAARRTLARQGRLDELGGALRVLASRGGRGEALADRTARIAAGQESGRKPSRASSSRGVAFGGTTSGRTEDRAAREVRPVSSSEVVRAQRAALASTLSALDETPGGRVSIEGRIPCHTGASNPFRSHVPSATLHARPFLAGSSTEAPRTALRGGGAPYPERLERLQLEWASGLVPAPAGRFGARDERKQQDDEEDAVPARAAAAGAGEGSSARRPAFRVTPHSELMAVDRPWHAWELDASMKRPLASTAAHRSPAAGIAPATSSPLRGASGAAPETSPRGTTASLQRPTSASASQGSCTTFDEPDVVAPLPPPRFRSAFPPSDSNFLAPSFPQPKPVYAGPQRTALVQLRAAMRQRGQDDTRLPHYLLALEEKAHAARSRPEPHNQAAL